MVKFYSQSETDLDQRLERHAIDGADCGRSHAFDLRDKKEKFLSCIIERETDRCRLACERRGGAASQLSNILSREVCKRRGLAVGREDSAASRPEFENVGTGETRS